jgi:hypothetical protein
MRRLRYCLTRSGGALQQKKQVKAKWLEAFYTLCV